MSQWQTIEGEYWLHDHNHRWVCGRDYKKPALLTGDEYTRSGAMATHWAPCEPPQWPPTGQEGE